LPDVEAGVGVQSEDRRRARVVEYTLLDHQRCAAQLAGRRAFFCRLKDEHDCPRQLIAQRGQDRGDTEENGRVDIMAAGVAHPDLLPEIGGAHSRLEGVGRVLGHRQGVHVGAHGDDGSRLCADEDAHHAGVCDAGPDLVEAEPLEICGHEACRLELPVAELRVLMDVVA
jgi:hypothetical protein